MIPLAAGIDHRTEFQKIHDFLSALSAFQAREIWLDAALQKIVASVKKELDSRLPLLKDADIITCAANLFDYYKTLGVADPLAEAQNAVERLCERLLDNGSCNLVLSILEHRDQPLDRWKARAFEGMGMLLEAVSLYENAGLWTDALRCHRQMGNIDGAMRCLTHLPETADAESLQWMSRLQTLLREKPRDLSLTPAETDLFRLLIESYLPKKSE